MKRLRRICLVVFLVMAGVILGVWGYGSTLSAEKDLVVNATFTATPIQPLFALLTDFSKTPTWKSTTIRIEELPEVSGHPVWREYTSDTDHIDLMIVEQMPPTRLVVQIANANEVGFTGKWTYTLKPTQAGTAVTIHEQSQIPDPIMRAVYTLMTDPSQTIQTELTDLGSTLNDPPIIEFVD